MDIRTPISGAEPRSSAIMAAPRSGAATAALDPSAGPSALRFLAPMAAMLGAVAAAALWLAAPDLARPGPLEAAAVLVLFLALWVTKTVSDPLAAIIFFVASVSVIGVPPEIALSGFHSSAVWLVLGGLIVGGAIKTTGLGKRIATITLSRSAQSYGAIVTGAVVVGALLAFIAPSAVGRVLMLTPIVLALADRLGFAPGSPGRNGMILAATLGTLVPSYAVLPASTPNLAMMGAAQNLYGIELKYVDFLAANFPVLGIASVIVLPVLICGLFRDTPRPDIGAPVLDAPTRDEKWLLAIIVAALVMWASDAVHGISPAWVALGAGMLCLAPGFGPARSMSLEQEVKFGVWLLVAALISLGAVINYCGLGEAAGTWLVARLELEPGAVAWNTAVLTAVGTGVSLAATAMGAPTIMTALAQQFATATGWPLEGVMLLQVPTWFFFPLPHQTPVLLIAMAIARVPVWPATRLLLAFTAIGLAVILPAQVLWLQLLGYLP
jgi:di/tricarboxylate transporter